MIREERLMSGTEIDASSLCVPHHGLSLLETTLKWMEPRHGFDESGEGGGAVLQYLKRRVASMHGIQLHRLRSRLLNVPVVIFYYKRLRSVLDT